MSHQQQPRRGGDRGGLGAQNPRPQASGSAAEICELLPLGRAPAAFGPDQHHPRRRRPRPPAALFSLRIEVEEVARRNEEIRQVIESEENQLLLSHAA